MNIDSLLKYECLLNFSTSNCNFLSYERNEGNICIFVKTTHTKIKLKEKHFNPIWEQNSIRRNVWYCKKLKSIKDFINIKY